MSRWALVAVFGIALVFLQGCGSSNSTPTPPPTPPPPTPQVTITAPADGTTVTSLPTTIVVGFSNGADPTTMKALLDGVDISSQFAAADSTGTRQVKVDRPTLNLGKNQIQIYAGSASAVASFIVALGSDPGSTQSASLPLLLPFQTRYVTGDGTQATDYNIALYNPSDPAKPNLISASTPSDGSNTGFQIVFLLRSDLSVISNITLPNPNNFVDGQFVNTPLYKALTTTPSGCGTVGCLLVPQLWLDDLSQLSFNSTTLPSSDQADFDAMKSQLTTEFQYVAAVRQLQANIRDMYNAQQSNVGLELQQAQDEVTASAQVALNTPASSASWLGILGDVFGVIGAVGGFAATPEDPEIGPAIATAAALGTLATQIASDETNTAGGTSLKAEEAINTTAGQMAGKAADEYARTLAQLGNQFDRIATDWGRLKTMGAPLLANQLPWDSNASGLLLRSYNRVILREFYTKLLQSVAQVNYYPYTSDFATSTDTFNSAVNVSSLCLYRTGGFGVDPYWNIPTVPVLFYPSGQANPDNSTNDPYNKNYPRGYGWATWGLVFNPHSSDKCPMSHTQPDTTQFGLFTPLDPNNPNSLGAYRLWWFTRNNYKTNQYPEVLPCYDGSGICNE